MTAVRKHLATYAPPSIVRVGPIEVLTKRTTDGDTCDGTPCTGNYWYKWYDKEEEPPPHDHDPKMPFRNPKSPPEEKKDNR